MTMLYPICVIMRCVIKGQYCTKVLYGPQREKTCHCCFVNNKGANQSAHLHNLISAIVIRLLESIISKLASCKISIV